MHQKRVKVYDLDISQCCVIGDIGKNEIVLAHNAGYSGILVLTEGGRNSLGKFRHTWADHEANHILDNILRAVEYIINKI